MLTLIQNFYPRSPCGERHTHPIGVLVRVVFLSTLSLRRATVKKAIAFYPPIFLSTLSLRRATYNSGNSCTQAEPDFYPRSPCGERPAAKNGSTRSNSISIHALLAESDHFDTLSALAPEEFLSTLSLRRATRTLRTVSVRNTFLSTLSLRRATSTSL